ncbi:MAG: hypothetical protein CL573_04105 [Alphaproteobacteria bacterium]|nr:hypothetical protein [Alphaproteobacteria bacterium]HCP00637.1 hypothetical protein [Rhodospirillaceae bacterium]
MTKHQAFNRAEEDIGNIIGLEHLNLLVPDQRLATIFYISGLGLTRDPYLMTGADIMWVNAGRTQFHLPTRGTQVLRGHTGLVINDFPRLTARLKSVRKPLKGTMFGYKRGRGYIEVVCPWGNRYRCYPPGKRFGAMQHGIPYICFDVPKDAADPIARFYRAIIGAPARIGSFDKASAAYVCAGADQKLIFRENSGRQAEFDGHHIQVYFADFSGPYNRLLERGLISMETDQHEYRFEVIVDPDNDQAVFQIEHEVRSLRHPLYGRPLVNRNPAQRNNAYQPGSDMLGTT